MSPWTSSVSGFVRHLRQLLVQDQPQRRRTARAAPRPDVLERRLLLSGIAVVVEDAVPGGGINHGNVGSNPSYLVDVNGTLYFQANDGSTGDELWRINSSGVAELVEDGVAGGGIAPGSGNSLPSLLTNVNGTLYFGANDGSNGEELWRINSSGVAELVEDGVAGGGIRPGSWSSDPRFLTNVNGTLYFSADGGFAVGRELWKVEDVNDHVISSVSDSNLSGNEVAENATPGTVVGVTAFATDADVSSVVSYSLTDDAGGRFAIDSSSGVVSVVGGLDAETAVTHAITVRASSSDGSSSSATFTITVADVNDNPVSSLSDVNTAVNTVAENSPTGILVGVTAFATDADLSNNSVSYSLIDDAGGRFCIDSTTGVVLTVAGLDFETDAAHSITVRAVSSDGSSSAAVFTIAVTDVDEVAPTVSSVRIASTSWSNAFRDAVDAADGDLQENLGCRIADGETLPWVHLNTIVLQFTEEVTVTADSLRVTGITVPDYLSGPGSLGLLSFDYNPVTLTARWVLNGRIAAMPMTADRIRIELVNVSDSLANPLAPLPVDQFNVNPGDINRNGQVNALDLSAIYPGAVGRSIGQPGYSIYGDVDGSGQIFVSDLLAFYPLRIGQTLPAVPLSISGSGVLSSVSSGGSGDDLQLQPTLAGSGSESGSRSPAVSESDVSAVTPFRQAVTRSAAVHTVTALTDRNALHSAAVRQSVVAVAAPPAAARHTSGAASARSVAVRSVPSTTQLDSLFAEEELLGQLLR